MKPLSACRLYAFVDTAYLHGRAPAEVARQLCEGGADLVQYRAKSDSVESVRRVAEQLLPVTRAAGVHLVINDHWLLARELDAPICHLGQEDFFEAGFTHKSELPRATDTPGTAPASAAPSPLLGLSSHAPEQARRAVAAGADYVAVGPVFPTGTKPGRPAVTLEYVRWAAANLPTPWFAIGGITLDNLESVLEAGAERVCVVSAILNHPDIAGICREFRRRLPE